MNSPFSSWRIAAALLALHLALAVFSMRQTSLTWDEPSYIGAGRLILETRNPEIIALQLHPPLSYYISSLLLLPLDFEPNRFQDQQFIYQKYIGPPLIFDSGYPPLFVMFLSRLPIMFLSVILGALVYKWSREIYGPSGAILSTLFYSLCPTILAHCRLATADILLALTMSMAIYSYIRFLISRSIGYIILTGFCLGFALLSKFTALLLPPTFIFMALAMCWRSGNTENRLTVTRAFSGLTVMFVLAAIIVWTGYGFQLIVPFVPQWLTPESERLMTNKPFWKIVGWLSNKDVRVPAYSYILGVYTQLAAAKGWQDNFLFGRVSSEGWWYFYWVAFALKTPIPFMICLLAAVAKRLKSGIKENAEDFLLLAMLPILVFFSLPTKINIGIRYILPLFPLLCVFLGKAATIEAKKWKYALVLLCVWYGAAAFWIHPRYITFFNEFVGGPRNGYKYLVDSNLDWGQSLHEVKEYIESNNIHDAKLRYFGPPDILRYYGLKNFRLNNCEPAPGLWIVSATYLQNLYLKDRHCHDWLRELEPEKVLGYSIFVYDVSEEEAEAQTK